MTEFNADTFLSYLLSVTERTSVSEILQQNPFTFLTRVNVFGLAAVVLAVSSLFTVAWFRKWHLATGILSLSSLLLGLVYLFISYIQTRSILLTSQTVPHEVELGDGVHRVLWVPLFCILVFAFVLVGSAGGSLVKILRDRHPDSKSPVLAASTKLEDR